MHKIRDGYPFAVASCWLHRRGVETVKPSVYISFSSSIRGCKKESMDNFGSFRPGIMSIKIIFPDITFLCG